MELRAFRFDPTLSEEFLAFGYDLYRDDPRWIPPLRDDLASQLSPAFPFYSRPGNDHRRFLALQGAKPVARALASVSRDLRDREGSRIGAIGFFEARDSVAGESVLSAAIRWLREEHGIVRIWGPMNFDIWHGYRFMTRGFELPPYYGEPYNRPEYPGLFEKLGFRPRQRWNTFELSGRESLEALLARGVQDRRRFLESGYRLAPFDFSRFDECAAKLYVALTASFSRFLGFTPIGLGEFRELLATARHALLPAGSAFVHDETGRLAGFTGVFKEVSSAVQAMKGRTTLLSRLRFACHRLRADGLMLHIGGMTPEEAAKHNGLARAAFYEILARIRALGYKTVLATLIAKGNPVRRLYGPYADDDRREYTLFELCP
jgi:hypothetical protein